LIARSRHETGRAASPPILAVKPKTKVAVVNLGDVLKNYDKFKTFQKDLPAAIVPFQAKDAAFKAEGEKLAKELNDNQTPAARRLQLENRIEELKKAIEENKDAAQKDLVKLQESHTIILYKDIETASRRYAMDHDIELVLHYNKTVNPQDYWDPQSIPRRKVNKDALQPLYMAPGIDISKEILAALNDGLQRNSKVE
jgi:Skp family chaperone for outer membrane proteins